MACMEARNMGLCLMQTFINSFITADDNDSPWRFSSNVCDSQTVA